VDVLPGHGHHPLLRAAHVGEHRPFPHPAGDRGEQRLDGGHRRAQHHDVAGAEPVSGPGVHLVDDAVRHRPAAHLLARLGGGDPEARVQGLQAAGERRTHEPEPDDAHLPRQRFAHARNPYGPAAPEGGAPPGPARSGRSTRAPRR
jgi:hypothetical protein